MDDVIVRTRYPRYSAQGRKRRRNPSGSGALAELLVKQAVFAAVLLLLIVGIKSANTPVTNYLTGKIQDILFAKIELKNVYETIDSIVNSVRNSPVIKRQEEGFGKEALPVSGGISAPAAAGASGAAQASGTDKAAGPVATAGTYLAQDTEERVIEAIKSKYTFITPADGVMTSPFGERSDPVTRILKMHEGIDIGAGDGAAIKASLAGEVFEAGSAPAYGKYVKIRHGDNVVTVYAHCSALLVSKGAKVKQGDIIAKVGNTGLSVGSHLHFEIWKDGKPLNPTRFIDIQLE